MIVSARRISAQQGLFSRIRQVAPVGTPSNIYGSSGPHESVPNEGS